MRAVTRVLLAGLLGAAALALPAQSASAIVCNRLWLELTGDCTPCDTAARYLEKASVASVDCPQG